ncbi:MAG: hypothetical protein B7Y40_03615 [Gammaproteobacteria bacterium 28-57-27]|nr:MAG: hypothetical protein B7Y40_03615 [Gammaproteobacteria bacterium 28-57-27]
MEGMSDILPPAAVHEGLAALLAPTAAHPWWLLAAIMLLLAVIAALWKRQYLQTSWRLWQAERALKSHQPAPAMATHIERLLRQQHQINVLHPEHAPCGVDAAAWRHLIDTLHAAKFSGKPVDLNAIRPALAACFAPGKAHGERTIVGCAVRTDQACDGAHGAPYGSRLDAEHARLPLKDKDTQASIRS